MTQLNQLAQLSAERMLNGVLEGIAIGLFAWILLLITGRRNSSTRFAVWFCALLAIAALPVLRAVSGSAPPGSSAITVPGYWALDIFFIWAAIAGVLLLRVGVGLVQLRTLRASCTAIDPASLDPLLQTTLQEFQSVRRVTLCHSDRLQVPTAVGFFNPLVVIPSWALHELSSPELNSILIHELAHLRRFDDWTNLAQQILKALLFFHPAVWWIESHLALEREMACDDAVLALTGNPYGYAQCLVSIAEKTFLRRGLTLAHAIVNRMRQTSLRVSRILDENHSSGTRIWKPALYSVAAALLVSVVSFSHAPELVAFQNSNDATSRVAVAQAFPAHATLASDVHRFEREPIATLASFHENSVAPVSQFGAKASARPTRPRSSVRMKSTAQAVAKKWQTVGSPSNERNAATQNAAKLLEAGFHQPEAENFTPTVLMTFDEAPTAQAFFVVMRTAQYEKAGPTLYEISVWRITVVHATQAAKLIIPTKQI
jgi:beta-lactamase regulating signal transducer with metallopeptidase domain